MTKNQEQTSLLPRPPIVAVLGHVDHGKTSLIDYIRKTNVAGGEAGGITQSIGAYEIEHPLTGSGQARKITFIDTPGHEAFTRMRSRGATVADLALLVVAADEGVKPQTEEAVKILDNSHTPYIVAITKIDRTDGEIKKIITQLAEHQVFLEGQGGKISYQGVSVKTGEGVSELLDLILLTAELENFTYDPNAPASGYILETRKDARRGLEVSAVLKNGLLKQGLLIQTGSAAGKVKILENFRGQSVKELQPSAPVLIIGFENQPQIGEEFEAGEISVSKSKLEAKAQARQLVDSPPSAPSKDEDKPSLVLILKAPEAGSLEALVAAVENLPGAQRLKIVRASVGDIHDDDVKTAIASQALIVGFKVIISSPAKQLAEIHRLTILTSEVIYKLLEDLEAKIAPLSAVIAGKLEILAVFNQTANNSQVVGGKVVAGSIVNKATIAVERRDQTVGGGQIMNLQQNKRDVKEVSSGKEAGLLIAADVPIQVGDQLIIHQI